MRTFLAATAFVLVASLEWGCAGAGAASPAAYDQPYQPSYREQRNRDLTLQSGATGCFPNYSTGVCR